MNVSFTHQALQNTQASSALGVCGMVYALAVFCSLLSLYIKILAGRHVEFDDCLIIAAAILMTGELVGYAYSIRLGFGKHIDELDTSSVITIYKLFYILELLYLVIIGFVKFSCMMLLSRFFNGVSGFENKLLMIMYALNTCYFIVAFFVTAFQCHPVQKAWSIPHANGPGSCMNLEAFYIGIAVPNIVTDVILIFLPIHRIIRLNTKTRIKVYSTLIFSIGSIVTTSSILRLWALLHLYYNPEDFSYIGMRPELWSFVETGMGIVIACSSCLPLGLRYLSHWWKENTGKSLVDSGMIKSLIRRIHQTSFGQKTSKAQSNYTAARTEFRSTMENNIHRQEDPPRIEEPQATRWVQFTKSKLSYDSSFIDPDLERGDALKWHELQGSSTETTSMVSDVEVAIVGSTKTQVNGRDGEPTSRLVPLDTRATMGLWSREVLTSLDQVHVAI